MLAASSVAEDLSHGRRPGAQYQLVAEELPILHGERDVAVSVEIDVSIGSVMQIAQF